MKQTKTAPVIKSTTRRLKKPRYKSFHLEKRITYKAPPTPGVKATFRETFSFIKKHRRVIFGIAGIYALLYIALVRGVGGGLDFAALKADITNSMNLLIKDGSVSNVTTVLGLVMTLAVNPTGGQELSVAATFYQAILLVIFVLAMIWALRQLHAGKSISVKDAYYKGMYPLVPFILIVCYISVQLIPLIFANIVLGVIRDSDTPVALTVAEQALWGIFWFLMMLATVYMVVGSLFALIIITLPDMTPLKAMQGAYDLLRFRRLTVIRRLVVLLAVALLAMAIIMLPALLWAVRLASLLYVLWSVLVLTLVINFLFVMYRRMLPSV